MLVMVACLGPVLRSYHQQIGKGKHMSASTLLRAEGFSCPSCVDKLEKALSKVDGVDAVTVHFATGKINVDHADSVDPELLAQTVTKNGYPAKVAAF